MARKSCPEIPIPPQSDNMEAADYLNTVYNNLMNKRVDLLIELDDNRRAMDDISLQIVRLEDAEDEPKKPEA